MRVTYRLAPRRRVALLTVFAKTRMREAGEVARAGRALARWLAEAHTADDDEEGGDGG